MLNQSLERMKKYSKREKANQEEKKNIYLNVAIGDR